MKVIIMGAGVVGVTTAYFLAKAGHKVTVIEKDSSPGKGCSYANAGQLSYSHIESWATTPLLSLIKSAIMPDSYLSIQFDQVKNKVFLSWLIEFLKNSSKKKARLNSQKLSQIANLSKLAIDEIIASERLNFNYTKPGNLHFFRSKNSFIRAIKNSDFLKSLGYNLEILSPEECIKKEPKLVKLKDSNKLAGGIYFSDDAVGDCHKFTENLSEICKEKYGVIFEYNNEIKNILTNHKMITGINSEKGVFQADQYIYCLGVYGNSLLNGIKINPKIYPVKGHSLSLPIDVSHGAPKLSLTDIDNKIFYSRLGSTFRVAGTVEFASVKATINGKKINFLKKSVGQTFSEFGNINQVRNWSGLRPFRPNSIPIIERVEKYGNLLINSGHGSLGFTLAAGSAKIISDIVNNKISKKTENERQARI